MAENNRAVLYSKTMKPGLFQNQQLYHPQHSSLLSVPQQPSYDVQHATELSRCSQSFLKQQQGVYLQLNNDQLGLGSVQSCFQPKSQIPQYGVMDHVNKNAGKRQGFQFQPGTCSKQPLQEFKTICMKGSSQNARQFYQLLEQQPAWGLQQQLQPVKQHQLKQQSQAPVVQQQQPQLQNLAEHTTSQKTAGLKRSQQLQAPVTQHQQFTEEGDVYDLDSCVLGPDVEELLLGISDDFFDNADLWENMDCEFDKLLPLPKIADDFTDTQLLESPKRLGCGSQKPVPLTNSLQSAEVSARAVKCEGSIQRTKEPNQVLGKRKIVSPNMQLSGDVPQQHRQLESQRTLGHGCQKTIYLTKSGNAVALDTVSSRDSSQRTDEPNEVLGKRKIDCVNMQQSSGLPARRVYDISALFDSSRSMSNVNLISKRVLGDDVSTKRLMTSSLGLKELVSESTNFQTMNKKRRV